MMFSRLKLTRALPLVVAIAVLACPVFATQTTKQLATGVTLYQEINTTAGAELVINCVTVDPKAEGVSIKAAVGKDVILTEDALKGCETIASMTGRRNAIIGVNADFFPMGTDLQGDPLGVCIIDGELVSEPSARHAVVAVLKDGTFAFDNPTWEASLALKTGVSRQIDGINRGRETNQVIAYTSMFDSFTRSKFKGTEVVCKSDDLPVQSGKTINLTVVEVRTDSVNTPIPKGGMVLSAGGPAASFLKQNLRPDDKLTVKFEVKSAGAVDWSQVQQAVGGRPKILEDGKEHIDLAYEKIGTTFSTALHPRTALGITADQKLMLVTVDGRQSISRGISLPDLSALMKRLGAVHAINLDGGGSTTMSYRGGIINSPSGGVQRSVADGLLVFANPVAIDELPKLCVNVPADGIQAGQGAQLSVTCGDDPRPLPSDQLDKIVWASANGMGFINQQGYSMPIRARQGSMMAFYGAQQVMFDVSVVAGEPGKLDIAIAPDKNDPLLARACISLADSKSNPCSAKPVMIAVTGGKTDIPSGVTDAKGQLTATITWDAGAAEKTVNVTSGKLTATATVPQPK